MALVYLLVESSTRAIDLPQKDTYAQSPFFGPGGFFSPLSNASGVLAPVGAGHKAARTCLKSCENSSARGKKKTWVWLKLKSSGYAGFSLWFHLPGCHLGTTFLSHSHTDAS